MRYVWRIQTLLQNVYFFHLGKGKNLPTAIYRETNSFDQNKTIKNVKITKRSNAYQGYASTCYIESLNSFNPEP